MQDAQTNYNDQTLPLLSLLFLANSDQNMFITAFKAINLAKRAAEVGSNINNVANMIPNNFNNMTGLGFMNLASGVTNAFNNIGGAYRQAQNPNLIRAKDLRNLMCYHLNFLTLLPVSLIEQYNEGGLMKKYFFTVLRNAFSKQVQNKFGTNKLFIGFEGRDEIDVNEFFNRNYNLIKNDNQLRKDLVTTYINNLSPTDMFQLVTNTN